MKKSIYASFLFINTIFLAGSYGLQAQTNQPSGISSIPPYIPTEGLLAFYPFTGNANDESGNNNNGVVLGASLSADRFGNSNSAYQFDGLGNYISVTPVVPFNFPDGITISVWVKVTNPVVNPTNLTAFLVSRGNDTESGHFHVAYDLQSLYAENGQHFQGDINGLGQSVYSALAYPYPQSEWHNVVFVHNCCSNSIFIDGVFSGEVDETSAVGTLGSDILFGKHQNDSFPYYLKGILDDIGIWNRVLTNAEIAQVYNANLSVPDLANRSDFTIYPNPSRVGESIYLGSVFLNDVNLDVLTITGKIVFSKLLKAGNNSLIGDTNISEGLYFLKFSNENGRYLTTRKILITK